MCSFFSPSPFQVLTTRKDETKHPRIKITCPDERLVAYRLAKAGYGGGDPQKVLEMPADMVVDLLHYEGFTADYERAYVEMNRPEGS